MTNITTVKTDVLAEVKEIKKPQLIIVEEKTKIQEYAPEEGLRNSALLVAHLIDLIGINGDKEEVFNVLTKFIAKNYRNKTIEEILHAFNLFVKRELNIKVFKQLDALVFGEVMEAYEKYKIEKLKNYRRKMQQEKEKEIRPSQEEKALSEQKSIDDTFKEFLETGQIPGARTYVYDILFMRGELPKHSKEFREMIKEKAIKLTRAQAASDKIKDPSLKIKNFLERVTHGKEEGKVKTNAKRIVLIQYFENKALQGEARNETLHD